MKRITFLLGAGLGFLLGSKAGNGRYEQLEAKVRGAAKRPRPGSGDAAAGYTPPSDVDASITTVTISEEVGAADISPIANPLSSGTPTEQRLMNEVSHATEVTSQ